MRCHLSLGNHSLWGLNFPMFFRIRSRLLRCFVRLLLLVQRGLPGMGVTMNQAVTEPDGCSCCAGECTCGMECLSSKRNEPATCASPSLCSCASFTPPGAQATSIETTKFPALPPAGDVLPLLQRSYLPGVSSDPPAPAVTPPSVFRPPRDLVAKSSLSSTTSGRETWHYLFPFTRSDVSIA